MARLLAQLIEHRITITTVGRFDDDRWDLDEYIAGVLNPRTYLNYAAGPYRLVTASVSDDEEIGLFIYDLQQLFNVHDLSPEDCRLISTAYEATDWTNPTAWAVLENLLRAFVVR